MKKMHGLLLLLLFVAVVVVVVVFMSALYSPEHPLALHKSDSDTSLTRPS